MAPEYIENQERRVANQGIRRSLSNSVIMGIIGGLTIGSIGMLSYGLSNELSDGLSLWLIGGWSYGESFWSIILYLISDGLRTGLLIGPISALLICMVMGGLAVWRHYIIRWLLRCSHTFPWKVPQFLDDATARFLLRRVGGGYSFSHRLLLDHLADAEGGATPSSNAASTQFLHP